MSRKFDSIDILKLYSGLLPGFEDDFVPQKQYDLKGTTHNTIFKKEQLTSHEKWNRWLEKCYVDENIYELVRVRYGLQVGMDDAVKAKLDNPALIEMFIRWSSSIERTARKIINKKNPIVTDTLEGQKAKKQRDKEFEQFMRKSSF